MADLRSLIREIEGEVLGIVRFCADEVERQRADPDAVCWMVQAWLDAMVVHRRASDRRGFAQEPPRITLEDVSRWGALIEPTKNPGGGLFRVQELRIGSHLFPQAVLVPALLKDLLDRQHQMEPDDFYLAFEEVHPFLDGNGRCGKIILGWLSDHLDHPERMVIPNPWGIPNP